MLSTIRDKILTYRDRFRRLDRKWHLLIGTQLLFVMATVRFRTAQDRIAPSTSTSDGENNSHS